MIKVNQLSKTYHEKKRVGLLKYKTIENKAVKGISLEVKPGQIVGLVGINGAGKTTIIKMLSTLLEPTSGSIFMDDINIIKNPEKARLKLNMIVGGERMLYWRLTAKENLLYFGSLYNIPKGVLEERAEKLLKLVGLYEVKDTLVEKYSKGMKQRLQIARGLINKPKYIFLDEPTVGLDLHIALEVREIVRNLAEKENCGIILTSHYLNEVEELSDYIYLLHKGEIVLAGTPKEITLNNDLIQYEMRVKSLDDGFISALKELTADKDSISIQNEIEGIRITFNIQSPIKQENVFELINKYNISLVHFEAKEPSLEKIVLAYMEEKYERIN